MSDIKDSEVLVLVQKGDPEVLVLEDNSEIPSCSEEIKLEDEKPPLPLIIPKGQIVEEIHTCECCKNGGILSDFSEDSDNENANGNAEDFDMECDNKEDVREQLLYQQPVLEDLTWKVEEDDESSSMIEFDFSKSECLLLSPSKKDPIDYFHHILPQNVIDEIIEHTNIHAARISSRLESKNVTWSDLTRDEMAMFMGMALQMGLFQIKCLEGYWEQRGLYEFLAFEDNMCYKRFLLLLKMLKFSETGRVNSTDWLYEIRKLVNFFNARMSEIYYPTREIIMDEPVVLWHGEPRFYLECSEEFPENAVKLSHLTTCPDGMILKVTVDSDVKRPPERVAVDLLDKFLDVGHSVFMSSYYSSFGFVKYLFERKTHCTGLVEDDDVLPEDIRESELMKGETIARYCDGVMFGKWLNKEEFCYISNEFSNTVMIVEEGKHKKILRKPSAMVYYDMFMAKINKKEQLLINYPLRNRNLKLPIKLFLHILQLVMINSCVLYNKYSGKQMTLYQFRLSVIKSLVGDSNIPPFDENEDGEIPKHHLKVSDIGKSGKVLRRQCRSCSGKGRRRDTMFVCTVCEGSPGYCMDCAIITHK